MKTKYFIILALLFTLIIMTSCSVPHMVVPQKDIQPREVNASTSSQKVLVASRKSDFKEAMIQKIEDHFKDQDVYINIIGMSDLNKENRNGYNAIVLINTCMSWDMDRNVNKFLKKNKDNGNVIVLTTSGDGGWMPKKKDRNFDAVASASKMENFDETVNAVIAKIDVLLKQ